ncbi:mucin-binding protein [Limosilactobacillus reuteri]|uniref:mucin-binding protein n=4 Tax=Limosilactobacillus reuteri TaxID=1598 RepID=UPI0027E0B897|nr:YSIRK-type signal peptide-containing protein [Limosilactobacillus reuteri]
MLSHNNWEEQIKKYEPKKQRFTIKKLSVGVASVLLGVTFAAGTASADSTTANADSASGSDSAEQADHNLTLNSASTSTLKSATAENQSSNASVAVQNPAGDIKAQAANDYEAAVNAAVNSASSDVASEATQNSASAAQNSAAQNTSAASSSAQVSTASAVATQSFTVSSSAVNNDLNYASVFASLAAMPQANTAAQSSAASSTANNDEYSGYKNVTNAFELQNAVNNFSVNGVNVKGNISLFSDLNINRAFTIHGVDGAVLNLGQNKINNNGQLTLADVTVNGSIMGNGTVNIKGNVTSNVNSVNSSVPTTDEYNAQNYTGGKNNFKNSNIAASRVNIENGASLTINSSEINDGINLTDGGTVRVGDNATLNVNLTNASTTATRYHVAGIFAKNGGNFISGYKSNVNFNTGLGQAIAIGATRPTLTDSDRFGGYGARSRNDGPTLVQLGDSSTFNFTGRDGIILGNNANFISGENSNVHFENKGRGVALDLANNSNIEISKHSTTYFHSVGKTGTSGSYDGYNYIGVNEGGNITVDEYATFRVILEGRGDNPWDDVVSLDSQNANTTAAFTSKTGAIVDIRDDNTNFYAELISFPLGGSNSRINIQDPLMLNLQRYSNGGATTGWMATGGDMINTTSSQYTSNLIYMSGAKGVFSVSGGDYDPSNPNSSGFVVYQHIKSDGSKQIWLNVNDVNIPMNGFQTKDIWNNQANPDVSINGNGLTGGIKANQVHNFNGSPLTGKDAPYYGISTQRASQQIWIPHRTPLEITGNHTNTIKYVDEKGNEIFPESTSSLNLKRNIVLDITQDQIKKIQDYALNHTADETLDYIKNAQAVSSDSGWKYTDANGNTVTDPYATVESPTLDGYTATIQSTNVQGLKAGEDGSSVTAKFAINPSKDIVQNGELSDSYKNNGVTGIPDNYVTVVVYKKAAEKGSVKVVYHDDTTNTDIPNTEYNTGSVDAGTKVDYSTSTTISNLEKQGYVYVTTDGTIPSTIEGNQNVVVTVHMKHGAQPVTPDTPTPDVPKTPDGKTVVDPTNLTKAVNLTVNYVNSDGTQFTGTIPSNAKQTVTFTGNAYVDKVTGQLVNATQQDGKWIADTNNTATPQITWTSDKTSFDKVVSPVEQNYHLISVSDHQDGNDVAAITGLTKDSGNLTVTVTYAPNGKIIPVDPSGNPIPDAPTPQYPTDPTDPSKVTPNEPVPNVPGYTPSVPTVTPTDPGKDTPVPYTKPAPEDQTIDSKQTVHYIDGDTNTALREDSTNGTFTFVKSGQTGQWNADSHKFETVDAPVINGYVAERRTYEGQTSTPTDPNKEITIIYHKVGKIIPVDPSGNPIPDAPTPSYPNDPTDPTKVTPNEPTPNVPGWTTDVPNVTPEVPTKDTNVPYTKPTPTPEDQTVIVKYIDDTTGDQHTDLSSYNKSITAKPGEALNYTTQGSITELENKGYKLVSDNFNVTTMPEKGGNYEVHFIHNTTTITPDKPGNPDKPINPNDPDGPKWPSGTDAKSLTKQGSQTVHYVYADGTKAADDNVQNTTFDHTLVFDNVTGKQIEDRGWAPESHKFNNVTSPTINGYHADKTSVDGATVTVDNPTSETTVTYTKNGNHIENKQEVKASQIVNYVDDQGNTVSQSKSQNFTFTYTGDMVDDVTKQVISYGKWLANDHDFTAEEVPVIDGYVAVSGYTNNDGKYTAGGFTTTHGASDEQRNRVFTVVYKKVGKIIPVGPDGKTPIPDAPTPSYPNDPTDPTKVTPNEPVPTIPGYTPSTPTVTPGVPTEDTPVPYTPVTPAKDQQALVNYVDADENNKVITTSGNLSGKAGERIDYSTATTIQDLENKGYVLVNDGFPAGATYDNDDGTVQTYTVVLRHGTQPVTPTDPGKPGEPINPNDPDGPKWPDGTDENSLKKTGTQTVHYVYADGTKAKDDNVQNFDFTKTGVVDKVTGKLISETGWNVSSHTFDRVDSPVIEGYHADKRVAGGETVTPDDLNKEVTVTYTPNGKIIPVDPSGKPIPNVPTPQYPTDPTDPTKVTPDEPVPEIPGYTPSVPTVTPTDPGKDTPVPYTPVTPAKDQQALVNYVDADENNKVITTSGNLSGKAGERIDYSTATTIQDLENKGYVLVNDGFPAGATYDNDDGTVQTYTVVLRHGIQPVTPTDPGKPGEPINPNDPDGPKYPDGSDQVTKNVTRTIQYVDENGDKISASVEQPVNFTAEGVLDKVTGQWTTPLTWSIDQTVSAVKSPVIGGYHLVNVDRDAAGNDVADVTLTHNDNSYTVTVKYAKNGKIIPVDPSGKPIPNVPQPQYPTDPTDPTKVTPNEPVPTIPGYTPETPTVTPTDPGKDTPVVYHPVDNTQNAQVRYIDLTNNEELANSGNLSGQPGDKINYSTADEIKSLEDKGYVLVNDGFPTDAAFDNDKDHDQVFTVTFRHGTQPVTPTNPGKPGEPINPNDPDGPKYPDGSDQVTKNVTRTVQYVDENGNKVSESVEQTVNFTAQGVLDKVTGQWITPLTWSGSQSVAGVKTPVVEGYHVVNVDRDGNGNNVAGVTLTHENDNYTVTVKYAKNGKIIPVDPSGKPIPNVPTPQYPTDPTDPAKVTPDEPVPNVPGYTPSVPTVTPTDPGKDTPVPYNPIVNDQNAVVNYVDQDNNNAQIATSGNLTGKPGSVINYSTADQIKQLENQGYVLVSDGFPAGATFDDDDNTTQTYTVVLKHGQQPVTPTNPGKPGEPINPNDPDGPKYPDGSDQVTKDVTRTIQYVDENGNKVSEPVEQTAHFTGEGVLDKVTGQWITPITWTGDGNLTGEKTPVVEGYHVVRVSRDSTDNINVDGTTVNHETNDYTVTVSYAKNGKIIPVDPSGKPIPNVPTPQYPTDPTDPAKVTPNEPVPNVPGYTPSVPTVTPTDPGKDTPVPYNPIVNDQTAVVNYVDQDNNNAQIATSGNLTGKPGSVINYSTADQIKQLEDRGYVLVSDGFPAGAVFDNDDNTTQTYTVVLKHGTTTFKPDKPGTPGEPINPNYPDGPKVTNEDVDYLKNVKFTVHYVGAGNDNPADNVQNAQWTRSITVDNLTGKIISSTEWVSNKGSYDGVKTPVINGYHADRAQVDGPSVTMEDQEATVTYVPNGKIIPVDPNGNPIPDVPTPQYPTDPTDPTKITPDEPVPTIPGYKPEVPTVTPTDPGVDTPVKYTPDTVNPKPAVDQIAIVNYVDQDNNNAQIATSGDLTGKAGDKINYSTADQIKELEAKGYVLVTDGFPAGATFDDNADQNQVFTVVLKHGHAPVGPNNPHEPGTPVNPDEPNGPKWPAKDTYTKEYTSTVHFVDNNGNKMRDDDVQTSTWTRTLIIDKVTGQIINPDEGWTADKGSYNEVKVPVINGYVADKANVPAKETVQQNLEDTVTYTKVGNIVPVDPNGNPIPNVPAVPYTNDPTDPTKVVPNEPVPSVPGMTSSVPTVTPTHPTVDTPVVYTTPTPVTPETPVTPQPDEPATPETPATPEPVQPATPQTPAAPQAETPAPVKTESAAPAKQEAKKLPQTGNENNSAAALGLAALGLTGLLAAGKKRRKED